MDGSVIQTYMSDILHAITQGLLVPDIVLLIAFIAYALFCIGSVIAEYFSERRHFQVTMPKFLADLMAAKEDEIPAVIERSGLLKRQKTALLTVYDYRVLPGDALVALIKRLVSEEESRYDRISGRNNMAARVSPMLGLMGTLIPLGPGIQALGKADTSALSASLLIAFDTTVAGLVVAAVCMIIGKIRSIWYANYMSALDSGMATMLQKIEDMRAEGKIVIKEPTDYAFLFNQSVSTSSKKDDAAGKSDGKGSSRGKGKGDSARGAVDGLASRAGAPLPAQQADSASALTPADRATIGAQRGQIGASQIQQPNFGTPVKQENPWMPGQVGSSRQSQAQPQVQSQSQSRIQSSTRSPYEAAVVDATKPFVANAPFEPVPDPSFITNLNAAQNVPGAVQGTTGREGMPGQAAGVQSTNSWYQPQSYTDATAAGQTSATQRMTWGSNGQSGSDGTSGGTSGGASGGTSR